MSFIIKSIFKSNSDLNSNSIQATNNYIENSSVNKSAKLTNTQIDTIAKQVLNQNYAGTCFQGLRTKAIKSSIKQYLREEKTKAIAHLLNEVQVEFKSRNPNSITKEEIEGFISTIKYKPVTGCENEHEPASEKKYGQLLPSEHIEHVVKNWHKITLILGRHKVIQVDKTQGAMVVTQNAKPIQRVAKYLNKTIDGELLLAKSKSLTIDASLKRFDGSIKQNKKIELAIDKALVSTFTEDEFHFSRNERELLYNAIEKKIRNIRAKQPAKYEDAQWVKIFLESGGITAQFIINSLDFRDDAYGRPINYSRVEVKDKEGKVVRDENGNVKTEKVVHQKEKDLFNDFAKKFAEPGFVGKIRDLCDIEKANPKLVEEAGLHDFRLFHLINKFAPAESEYIGREVRRTNSRAISEPNLSRINPNSKIKQNHRSQAKI